MTLQELICLAKTYAARSGIAESDYWFILTALLQRTRSQILLNSGEAVAEADTELVLQAFSRLENGEPPQYIVGKAWFRGLELTVTPAVLIPRPETEMLIDIVLPKLKPASRVLEIGTGSAAIAIAMKKERPDLHLVATEICAASLQVAKTNAEKHSTVIDFKLADLYTEAGEKYDCLISNPPYISSLEMDSLDIRVKNYEPKLALWGGEDGLNCYRRLLAESADYLKAGGFIALEHGYQQRQAIDLIAAEHGWINAGAYSDLSGKDRFLVFSRIRNNV